MAFRESVHVWLTFPSQLAYISLAEGIARAIFHAYAGTEDERDNYLLAFHEAVANAVIHGNRQDASKFVEIHFILEPNGWTVEVWDQGSGFDPTHLPDPTAPENLLNPHGRGIFLIRAMIERVDFQMTARGTCVRMQQRTPYRNPIVGA